MDGRAEGEKGLKLFGVRIVDGEGKWKQEVVMEGKDEAMKKTMPKSFSMVNLAVCNRTDAGEQIGDHGYLSDGGIGRSVRRGGQEKKRGVKWTEEEHRTFLAGLEELGKGDWRGISRNFVMTRTPTQVASHAQKYFLRKNNPNKKKRRSSLFDVVINNKITNSETPLPLPLNKSDETFEMLVHQSQDKDLAIFSSLAAIQLSPPDAASCSSTSDIHKINTSTASAAKTASPNQSSAALNQAVPAFLELPDSSKIDGDDLELTIAPPQPHSGLANFSSGIIRVV